MSKRAPVAAAAAAAAGSTTTNTPAAYCEESRTAQPLSSSAPAPTVQQQPQARPNAVRKPCTSLKDSRVSTPALCFSSSRHRGKDKGAETRFYAIDAEMVTVVGPGELPERRAIVSVGVVNERLETLLYSRVAVPKGCEVTNGAFARMEGGLWASWEEGIPASCVSDFLDRHTAAGGVLVGWEIHNDLDVVGFEKAAHEVRSGGRENISSERAPIDGRDFSLKTPQSDSTSSSSSSSPLLSTSATGRRGGCGGSGSSSDGTDLQVRTGNKDGRGTDDAHERGKLQPEAHPEEQGAALEREGINIDVALGNEECSGATQADGLDQRGAPKVTAGEFEDNDRWSGSGEKKDAGDDYAKGRPKGEEGPMRTGGGKMRVVEVTDLFRTMKGLKCALGEAYTCCFGRTEEGSHNAAVDARMTMELYNLWRRAGEPEQPFGLPLSFFVVNFHSFKPSRSRHATLWSVLRPDGTRGSHGAVEKDSGSNTYKLSFRTERSREAYVNGIERKMSSAGLEWEAAREFVPGKRGAGDGYQLSCGMFKMHVLEHER